MSDAKHRDELYWGAKSSALMTDFTYGYNSGQLNKQEFFGYINSAIETIIEYEYTKSKKQSNEFDNLLVILKTTLSLISKQIEKDKIETLNPKALFACLHGFLTAATEKF